MAIAARVMTGLVALLHVYFAVLEMFLWATPYGRKTFGTTEAFANESASLAKNQGLYNLFLVAGLVWSLAASEAHAARALAMFFLGCVVVAGVYGAITANKKILFVQALPAAIALTLVVLA